MTRTAISPRLAIRIFLNIMLRHNVGASLPLVLSRQGIRFCLSAADWRWQPAVGILPGATKTSHPRRAEGKMLSGQPAGRRRYIAFKNTKASSVAEEAFVS